MITTPPGWTSTTHGDEVVLSPPRGIPGRVTYLERRRPARELAELIDVHAPAPGFEVERVSPPRAILTDEGEYALAVTYHGSVGGSRVTRPEAFVMGDDFYAHLAGSTTPEHGDLFTRVVQTLARTDAHMLGVRRRRYLHVPPLGWHGQRVATFHSRWAPDDGTGTEAWAMAAVPASEVSALDVFHALATRTPGGYRLDAAPYQVHSAAGLSGRGWELTGVRDGEPSIRQIVILEDRRYLYPLCIDHAARLAAPMRAHFAALVGSVRSLPERRTVGRRTCEDLATHWLA